MATSGVSTYTYTRDQIIKAALRKLGVLPSGGSPSTSQTNDATEALNLLVSTFVADGLQLWKEAEYQLSLIGGQNTYTLPVRLPKVIQAFRRSTDNVDTPMILMTRQEYNMLGNKVTPSGPPIQLYHQPLAQGSIVKIFPTPGSTDASANTVQLTYADPIDVFTAGSNDADFPQEWYEALVYGLADRLAPEYGIDLQTRGMIKAEAERLHDIAKGFDQEEGSIYFKRDTRFW